MLDESGEFAETERLLGASVVQVPSSIRDSNHERQMQYIYNAYTDRETERQQPKRGRRKETQRRDR